MSLKDLRHQYNDMAREVVSWTDGLGKPLDVEIAQTVIFLNLLGVKTVQSCHGHVEEKGVAYPWIMFHATEPADPEWYKDEALREVASAEVGVLYSKCLDLLEEFYGQRQVHYRIMLGFSQIGYGFILQSNGVAALSVDNKEECGTMYPLFVAEMAHFTDFLRQKYFLSTTE